MKLRLLLVEDDQTLTDSWLMTIEMVNADNPGTKIIPTIAVSYQDAIEELDGGIFDAVVVDLRLKVLPNGGHHNQQGNDVVRAVIAHEAIPTVIYTGQPNEKEDFSDAPNIRLIEKGKPFSEVLDYLKSEAGLIQQMQLVRKTIKTDMARVFQSSIWPRWRHWIAEPLGNSLNDAVTRHFIAHLHEGLLNKTGEAHPEEWYFVPPIRKEVLSTGDLFQDAEGIVEILVTPRCDLDNPKNGSTLQFATCEDFSTEWDEVVARKQSDQKKAAEAAQKAYLDILQHKRANRFHFLPRMKNSDGSSKGPWFIRFDKIRTEQRSTEMVDLLIQSRFATLTPEFLPSAVERLGSFFSRIGTPNHSEP